VKKLAKRKKKIEHQTQRQITIIILSTMDLNGREKSEFKKQNIVFMRKPVRCDNLKQILTHVALSPTL